MAIHNINQIAIGDQVDEHANRASTESRANREERSKTTAESLRLAATLASGIALTLTLLGSGVSYALEAEFGLPHASDLDLFCDIHGVINFDP